MILTAGSFDQVVQFASAFAGENDSITFSPCDSGLKVHVAAAEGIGSISVSVAESSLAERFTVRFGDLPKIANELSESGSEHLEITVQSSAKFFAHGMEWWLNFRAKHVEPPRIRQENVLHWDSTFQEILSRVYLACRDDSTNGCLDSVFVEQSDNASSMVATDGSFILAYDDLRHCYSEDRDSSDDDPISFLLRKRHVPMVQKVCEAGIPVHVHIGISYIKVASGRRSVTLPKKKGKFVRWRNIVRDGSKGKVYGFAGLYCEDVDASVNHAQIMSKTSVVTTHKNGIALSSHDNKGAEVESVLNAEWGGDFGPFAIRNEYLRKVSLAWPEPDFKLSFRGKHSPIEVGSVFFRSPMIGMIMPVKVT